MIRILKLSADDLKSYLPEDQGAGKLIASRAYYIAWLLTPSIKTQKQKIEMSQALNVEDERKELQWTAKRLWWQMAMHGTELPQQYGEMGME